MKKANISQMHLPDQKSIYTKRKAYSVYLGNNTTTLFTDRKKANKYITDANRFVNNCLQELNLIYVDVFREFRRVWFANNTNFDNNINIINRAFKLVVGIQGGINLNHLIFIHLLTICNELKEITKAIEAFYSTKKEYSSANVQKTICRRIDFIIKDMENFGK